MKKYRIVVLLVVSMTLFFSVAVWSSESSIVIKTGKMFSELTKILENNIGDSKKAATALNKYVQLNKVSLSSLQTLFESFVKKEAALLLNNPRDLADFIKKFTPVIGQARKLQNIVSKLSSDPVFAKEVNVLMALITKDIPVTLIDGSSFVRLGIVMDDVIKIVKDNSDNPKAAAVALNKYMKANGVKLAALQKDITKDTDVIKKDSSKFGGFMKKIAPLIKKGQELQRLTVELMKNPEFAKAMSDFRATASAK